MKTIIRGGILLGVLVTIWTYIFGLTGMHKNMGSAMMFPIVATVIELGVLLWALRRTAAEGRNWFGQVSAGTMLAFVGGCLILATSYIYLTQIHPTYPNEVHEAGLALYRSQGMPEARIEELTALQAPYEAPMAKAVMGFVATVITGLILSAILAIFIRSKAPRIAATVPAAPA
ncbi:MAG: DUF4199 domain-containing protein [Candidatus Eisenbacteria bacterium]